MLDVWKEEKVRTKHWSVGPKNAVTYPKICTLCLWTMRCLSYYLPLETEARLNQTGAIRTGTRMRSQYTPNYINKMLRQLRYVHNLIYNCADTCSDVFFK